MINHPLPYQACDTEPSTQTPRLGPASITRSNVSHCLLDLRVVEGFHYGFRWLSCHLDLFAKHHPHSCLCGRLLRLDHAKAWDCKFPDALHLLRAKFCERTHHLGYVAPLQTKRCRNAICHPM